MYYATIHLYNQAGQWSPFASVSNKWAGKLEFPATEEDDQKALSSLTVVLLGPFMDTPGGDPLVFYR